jgi:PAS domain S-box-containing protein
MLRIAIAASGWLLLGLYLLYEAQEHGPHILTHYFSAPESPAQLAFHLLILLAPIASTCIGSLLGQRDKLLRSITEISEKYRDLYENAPDGYFSVSPDGALLEANRTFFHLLGYEAGDALRRANISEILRGREERETYRALLSKVAEDGSANYTELTFRRRDGHLLTAAVNAVGVRGEGDTLEAIRMEMRDITELRTMEQELKKRDRLQALGSFTGNLAHDFTCLLKKVKESVASARAASSDVDEVQKRLDRAGEAAHSAAELALELLTFSGGMRASLESTSPADFIEESVSRLQRHERVTCAVQVPDDAWTVMVDREQMRRAMDNLLRNAVEAMPTGGTVTVRAENVSLSREDGLPLEDGDYVRILLQDQGVGVPEEHLQRIFDPYFTTNRGRTGLGLTSAYSIVLQHGGHIGVQSEVGSGTTFAVYLPAGHDRLPVPEKRTEVSKHRDERRLP